MVFQFLHFKLNRVKSLIWLQINHIFAYGGGSGVSLLRVMLR